MRLQCQTITLFALVAFAAIPVFGQDRKKSGDASFDVRKFLKRLDENDNGMVEPSEIEHDRTRSFLKNAGADVSKPISIKSFAKRMKEEKKSKRDSKEGGTAQKSMGFAVAADERDDSTGDSPGFAVLDEEKAAFEQARTRDFGPAAKNMLDWVLRKYDRNNDGKIDSEEIKAGRWADPPASESDTNKDGSLSRMELLVRYQNREDEKNGTAGRDRDLGDRGRDRARGDRERSRAGSSSSSSSSSGGRDVRKGYESYVDGIFKSYDKNADNFLDKEELAKMRRKPDQSADANSDSKISKVELLDSYLAKAGQGKGKGGSIKKSAKSSSGDRSSAAVAVASKSGVSGSQLTSKDRNENGQIEMAEFESKWTVEKIEEFNAKDLNRDGVITKAEWETK